jgi:hypothetical protein
VGFDNPEIAVMKNRQIPRRAFLESAALGSAAILLERPLTASAATPAAVKIGQPFSGAVFNRRHGKAVAGGLAIPVSGTAPPGDRVLVCGQPAQRQAERFTAEVILRQRETDITAVSEGTSGRCEDRVRVVWDRNSFPRYRFSIDDNSFFLRDIAEKNYRSLFDCFYLANLRDLHRKYGVKFVLNIYYTTADGFDISQFPDRYKSQWRDCSDWLSLAFHAYANDPARPYEFAPPEKLAADFDLVAAEIHRFAGPQSYSPPTVIHFGLLRPESLEPLYDRGVRVLSGGFSRVGGRYVINYGLNDATSAHLDHHNAWKDFRSGIVFSRCVICCNLTPLDQITATLEPASKDPNLAEIMDVFTHEQYFWPFYFRYIPDHFRRLDATIRWITEHGYKAVFFHEGFLGAPL